MRRHGGKRGRAAGRIAGLALLAVAAAAQPAWPLTDEAQAILAEVDAHGDPAALCARDQRARLGEIKNAVKRIMARSKKTFGGSPKPYVKEVARHLSSEKCAGAAAQGKPGAMAPAGGGPGAGRAGRRGAKAHCPAGAECRPKPTGAGNP